MLFNQFGRLGWVVGLFTGELACLLITVVSSSHSSSSPY